MILIWPNTMLAQLAWAHSLLAWFIATYFVFPIDATWDRQSSSSRGMVPIACGTVAASIVPTLLLDLPLGRSLLLGAVGAPNAGPNAAHSVAIPFAPQIELVAPVMYVLTSGIVVGNAASLRGAIFYLPTSGEHITALLVLTCCVAWLLRGGTHFVRAVLANAAVPAPDASETRRGRLIGNMERLLLAGFVGVGAYQALGFLIAAKGLIRSSRLTDYDFSEYFLVGTLASAAPAIAVGWILLQVFARLW